MRNCEKLKFEIPSSVWMGRSGLPNARKKSVMACGMLPILPMQIKTRFFQHLGLIPLTLAHHAPNPVGNPTPWVPKAHHPPHRGLKFTPGVLQQFCNLPLPPGIVVFLFVPTNICRPPPLLDRACAYDLNPACPNTTTPSLIPSGRPRRGGGHGRVPGQPRLRERSGSNGVGFMRIRHTTYLAPGQSPFLKLEGGWGGLSTVTLVSHFGLRLF